MSLTSSPALVLRRHPYGETSLVCELLTPRAGRVSVLARGAYRPGSRFYCVLDWFHRLELTWRDAPGGGLALLVEGDVDLRRRRIPEDLLRYRTAHRAVELIERATRHGEPAGARFRRLDAFLDALEDPECEPDLELVRFDLWMLRELGLEPALDRCAACGRAAPAPGRGPERDAFSAEAGGRLCPECAVSARSSDQRVGTLPSALLDGAAAIARGVDAGVPANELRAFLDRFLVHHLESQLESRRFDTSARTALRT